MYNLSTFRKSLVIHDAVYNLKKFHSRPYIDNDNNFLKDLRFMKYLRELEYPKFKHNPELMSNIVMEYSRILSDMQEKNSKNIPKIDSVSGRKIYTIGL